MLVLVLMRTHGPFQRSHDYVFSVLQWEDSPVNTRLDAKESINVHRLQLEGKTLFYKKRLDCIPMLFHVLHFSFQAFVKTQNMMKG